MPLITRPICFISYSWDSDEHKAWVAELANELYRHSVNVQLDQWDTYLGMNLPKYMESAVSDSNYVIIVCTPNYAKKANETTGGTGYEKQVITGEILSAMSPHRKFIPVLRTGQPHESIPVFLRGNLYLDFRDDSKFADNVEHLVTHMNAPQSRSCAFILGSLYATNTNALMRDPISQLSKSKLSGVLSNPENPERAMASPRRHISWQISGVTLKQPAGRPRGLGPLTQRAPQLFRMVT